MKHIVGLLVVFSVFVFVATISAATNNGEYTNAPFTADSIYISSTNYTPVGSLSVTQDTAGASLFFVSGTIELGNFAWVDLVLCTDTNASGVPEIAIDSLGDTTDVTLHEWYWREDVGSSKMRIPFSFTQPLITDSVGAAIPLYLMGRVKQAGRPTILHDVRIDALVNFADQP